MTIQTYWAKFSPEFSEAYESYVERIGVAMMAQVVSAEPLNERIEALAVLAVLAPSEVDARSMAEPRPTKQVRDFLSQQSPETRELFLGSVLRVDPRKMDKANFYLGNLSDWH